jgi:hypothetical protein
MLYRNAVPERRAATVAVAVACPSQWNKRNHPWALHAALAGVRALSAWGPSRGRVSELEPDEATRRASGRPALASDRRRTRRPAGYLVVTR